MKNLFVVTVGIIAANAELIAKIFDTYDAPDFYVSPSDNDYWKTYDKYRSYRRLQDFSATSYHLCKMPRETLCTTLSCPQPNHCRNPDKENNHFVCKPDQHCFCDDPFAEGETAPVVEGYCKAVPRKKHNFCPNLLQGWGISTVPDQGPIVGGGLTLEPYRNEPLAEGAKPIEIPQKGPEKVGCVDHIATVHKGFLPLPRRLQATASAAKLSSNIVSFASGDSTNLFIFAVGANLTCSSYYSTFHHLKTLGIDVLCPEIGDFNYEDWVLAPYLMAKFYDDHFGMRLHGKKHTNLKIMFGGDAGGAPAALAAGLRAQKDGMNVVGYSLQNPSPVSTVPSSFSTYVPADMMSQITGTISITCGTASNTPGTMFQANSNPGR